jgi:hypothetical protein
MGFVARAMVVSPLFAALGCGAPAPEGQSDAGQDVVPSLTEGSSVDFGAPGSGACVPKAPSAFVNAVCVCEDMDEAGLLDTHAPKGGTASVGVNGRYYAGTGATIEGSYMAYGGFTVAGEVTIRDDLVSTGSVTGVGVLDVGMDLSAGGAFTFGGDLTVDGALRLAKGSTVFEFAPSHIGHKGPYVAPSGPPCACATPSLLPIAREVSAAATENDDAAHGLSSDGATLLGKSDITLTTGKYYFHDTTRLAVAKIAIQGAVALFVDGATFNIGLGQFSISPGSSLDIYVSGTLATAGAVELGDPTRPEAFRLFVGGAGSLVATVGEQAWSGLVYAPQANVDFGGVTDVHGSVFAKTLSWVGVLDVTYAGGPRSAGPGCTAPPPPPTPPPPK